MRGIAGRYCRFEHESAEVKEGGSAAARNESWPALQVVLSSVAGMATLDAGVTYASSFATGVPDSRFEGVGNCAEWGDGVAGGPEGAGIFSDPRTRRCHLGRPGTAAGYGEGKPA